MAPEYATIAPQAEPRSQRATGMIGVVAMIVLLSAFRAVAHRPATDAPATPPTVVATRPTQGQRIAPGRLVVSVTFDRAMTPDSYSFTTPDGTAAYPQCKGKPTRSTDGRMFSLTCLVQSGRSYAIGFNGGSFNHFTSADTRQPAEPAVLRFSVR